MAETKYGKYIIREPIEKGRMSPSIHLCAEENCIGTQYPSFPAEITTVTVTQPTEMNPKPHAHEYDQFLCFYGPNPANPYEFDGEVEVYLGEEGEKHVIDTMSIVYLPKGLVHCPLKFTRVGKPIFFTHLCFHPTYTRSVGDMSGHPPHSSRTKFSTAEADQLRGRAASAK